MENLNPSSPAPEPTSAPTLPTTSNLAEPPFEQSKNWLALFRDVLSKPGLFFRLGKDAFTIVGSMRYLGLVSVLSMLVAVPSGMLDAELRGSFDRVFGNSPMIGILLLLVGMPLVIVLGQLFRAGITHPIIRLLGGQGTYAQTYAALAYGFTPGIFSAIPLVSIFASLWAYYITFLGLQKLHNVSLWKAFAADLLASFVVFGLAFIGIAILVSTFSFRFS